MDLFCSAAASLSKHQLLAERKIRWREPMVKHEINEHAGDRNIEPDRHRPTPEPAMSIPAALENRNERHDHQRQGDEGEQNVGDENREINPGDQTGVTGRFFAGMQVIDDVTDQKTARCDQSDDHARHVSLPDIAPDPEPPRRNENGAERVERRIDRWQIINRHVTDSHR